MIINDLAVRRESPGNYTYLHWPEGQGPVEYRLFRAEDGHARGMWSWYQVNNPDVSCEWQWTKADAVAALVAHIGG